MSVKGKTLKEMYRPLIGQRGVRRISINHKNEEITSNFLPSTKYYMGILGVDGGV